MFKTALRHLALSPVYFYQLVISPWLPSKCRFTPSCSTYMIEAVKIHGVIKGGLIGIRRILRCHPFGGHGYAPVPPVKNKKGKNK